MKTTIFNLLCFFLSVQLFAQEDCEQGKLYDHLELTNEFKTIVALNDGDYIMSGWTHLGNTESYVYPPSERMIDFVRADACGDTLWTSAYGNTYESFKIADMCYEAEDDFVVAVMLYYNYNIAQYYYGLAKLNLMGDTLWVRKYLAGPQLAFPKSVIQTADGGYAIVGYDRDTSYSSKIWFIKTDGEGNIEWDIHYSNADSYDTPDQVLQLPDGGYLILAGRAWPPNQALYLIRTNAIGVPIWENFYSNNGSNWFTGDLHLVPLSDGYLIGGRQKKHPIFLGNDNGILLKTDTAGNVVWERVFNEVSSDAILKVMQLEDGNFVCIGNKNDLGWLFKTNSEGYIIWSKNYNARFEDFKPAPDGGFMICGFKNNDAWAMRTDSLGNPCPPYNGCLVGVSPNQDPLNGDFAVNVYPNPAQNQLYITLHGFLQEGSIEISDIQGKVLTQIQVDAFQSELVLPVGDFPSAMYLLLLKSNNNKVLASQKWVKQ